MGETHAARFKQLGQGVVILEPHFERQQVAKKKGFQVYSSIGELPETPSFASICTPTHQHILLIKEIAQRYQVPLFVEKPVVRTVEEAAELRGFAEKYPYPIFVGEGELFNPDLSVFHTYSGKPKHIAFSRDVNLDFFLHGTKPWFLDESLSGGIVLDLMIHDITLLMAKYGRPQISEASGKSTKYDSIDDVHANLAFDGFTVSLHSSWTYENKKTPIVASIDIEEQDGKHIKIVCDSYAIRDENSGSDPFLIEDRAFLQAVHENKSPYQLSLFLEAVEVANEIRSKIKPL
jgi:predicted dehydrogenase